VTVVDGWKTVLTPDHLLTADPDTPPDLLRYDVITEEPEVGRLSMRGRAGAGRVTSFSQADVNEGRLEFVHSSGSGSGSFVIQVVSNR